MDRNACILILSLLLWGQSAQAQVSPGELGQPHAKFEGLQNCTKCHTVGDGPDSEKCLQCHVEIKQMLNAKKGYHFFVQNRLRKACFSCHSDHNGRDFDMIFWPGGKDNFDHNQTGYGLRGAHTTISCEACHKPKNIRVDLKKLNPALNLGKTFLGLIQDCLGCHQDEHRNQLSGDCLQCHTNTAWKPAAKFDHSKSKFPLEGKHRAVACLKCHPTLPAPNSSFSGSKATFVKFVDLKFDSCTPCHKDVHNGKFGSDCQKCHNTAGWKQVNSGKFDHSLTRFPLLGSHQSVACTKCHGPGNKRKRMPFANCTDCHKDVHFGQFADRKDGGRCESCHDVFGFRPAKFDVSEHQQTEYPLTGAHLAVPCVRCHVEVDKGTPKQRRLFDFVEKSCRGCHQDIHQGQFAARVQKTGCETCHQTAAWAQTLFNHDTSRFPLMGKHAETPCSKCHKPVDVGTRIERILFKPMALVCESCHNDVHVGQFRIGRAPKTCDKCHTPIDWVALVFDHSRDTRFRLKGAHREVPCGDCHKVRRKQSIAFVLFRPMNRRCVSCHG